MSEIFDEVQEEVRREQLRRLWQRYATLIVTVALLIVAGVGGWRGYLYWEGRKAQEAGAQFEAAVALADQKKSAEAEAAFLKIAAEAPQGYRVLAKFRAAAERGTRDVPGAVKLYDEIASDRNAGAAEQDLAALRAASLLVDTASYADIKARLEPLTGPNRTYRHSARELLAVSAWRNKDMAAARQWIDMIGTDAASPQTLRSRMEALQALLPSTAKG
ncbi:tetratricopeptide repeat protein [Bradyrhizobium sp. LHD-71]|uniref:tetratricopeptide repeat protein n=1 Tax=Bradyrhizobium sp. LHD-71 TaxID=3072141 RepID=UPI00280CAAA0|nr:tetratricopeptide repeat protein [Bradyrhizobium sp. LHD-71]MDQ8729856.1 tetratricopeptide repeat protein [Bradyrhizobium sp. LHD-71]